ncbi:MAG: hypothetical protein QOI19_2360, partial [Thermoleophilaceae bacterium]|nr:hypothetical protein [Thermoleophilaceae bacterium]
VRPAGVSAADGCNGVVRVRFQSAGKTISNELAAVASNCNYRQVTVFDNRRKIKQGKLVVKISFLGNRFLLAANATTRKARAG